MRSALFVCRTVAPLVLLFAAGEADGQPRSRQGTAPSPFAWNRIRFDHITETDGLPENSVHAILQDSLGFIWLGTQNGLARYDGVQMRVFEHDPEDPFSFAGRWVLALLEDRRGDVWVGSSPAGLIRYERASGRFFRYGSDDGGPHTVGFVHEDQSGSIWYLEDGGLKRIDRATDKPVGHLHDPQDPRSLGSGPVVRIGEFVHLTSFYEDATGTIWIGTSSGTESNTLNRYDRATDDFTRFVHDRDDPTSLGPGVIGRPLVDSLGRLWVPTHGGGLSRLDDATGRFTRYRHDPRVTDGLPDDDIYYVYEDSAHNLWLGTGSGVCRFDPVDGSCRMFRHVANDQATPNPGLPIPVHESDHGVIVFLSDLQGISIYEPDRDRFWRIRHDPDDPASLSFDWVSSFLVDRSGTMWVGTNMLGLNKQDPTVQFGLVTHDPNRPDSPGSGDVRIVYQPPSDLGVLWIGHDQGLDYLDRASNQYIHFEHEPRDPLSLLPGRVYDIFEDHAGRLWVGSEGGVSLLDRATGRFTNFVHKRADAASLNPGAVLQITQSADGFLWLSVYGSGISRFHPDSLGRSEPPRFTHIGLADSTVHPKLLHALDTLAAEPLASIECPGDRVDLSHVFSTSQTAQALVVGLGEIASDKRIDYGWLEDADGSVVWEMSREKSLYGGGDPDNRIQIEVISLDAGSYRLRWRSDAVHACGSWTRARPTHPERWGIRLIRVTPSQSRALRALGSLRISGGLPNLRVTSALEDSDGLVWIGTDGGGLGRLNRDTGRFRWFYDELTGPRSIWSVYEDRAGRIWAADYFTGLHRIDGDLGSVEHYGASEGFPSNSAGFGIAEDDDGRLWVASANGIVRVDPKSRQVRRFDASHGLPERVWRVVGAKGTGEILVAGQGGMTTFFPDWIRDDTTPPEVILTGFDLFGRTASVGPAGVLGEDVSITEELSLAHDNNDFTIRFAAIQFARPGQNRYSYRLIPYESDWVEAGRERSARYTNVPPGDYTFVVRAASPDGVWNEKGRALRITIRPPWWRTWWAYGLYLVLLIGLIVAAFRAQRIRVERREQEKARERELAQAGEIRRAYQQLEETHGTLKVTQARLIQQEKMASLGQLTAGIAHEIQNPLNFVTNFAEVTSELAGELAQQGNSEPDVRLGNVHEELTALVVNANHIAKHGRRAEAIVKSMMEHAAAGKGERYDVALNAFLDEYVDIASSGLRARVTDLDVEIERMFDPAIGNVRMSPREVGRAVMNIVNNALEAVVERQRANRGAGSREIRETSSAMSVPDTPFVPRIRVESRMGDGTVEIRVSDNGMGIPPEVRDRVFEPFFTTKPTGTGTGLGLSLAYEIIVDGHGGSITVESEKPSEVEPGGNVTTFVVELPIGDAG